MMFVILGYDVGEKRVAKMRRIAEKYLIPIQNSLFQGNLTENQLRRLQREIAFLVDPETDRVVFYKTESEAVLQMDEIGYLAEQEMIL